VDSLGLIAPGKAADLVILQKDPLADIRNTRSIQAVMSRGRLYRPDSLRASPSW
jgi:imidazolonepropionase-like amidohydrolase